MFPIFLQFFLRVYTKSIFKKRRDINSWLVRNGLAVAYTKYSKKYIINENDAKKEKKGLWAGNFEMPWEWRKKRK